MSDRLEIDDRIQAALDGIQSILTDAQEAAETKLAQISGKVDDLQAALTERFRDDDEDELAQ